MLKWYNADKCHPDEKVGKFLLLARTIGKQVTQIGFYSDVRKAYYTLEPSVRGGFIQIDPLLWAYAPSPEKGNEIVGADKEMCRLGICVHQYQAVLHRIGSESVKKELTEWMDDDKIVSESVQQELRRIAGENPMSTIEYNERYIIR